MRTEPIKDYIAAITAHKDGNTKEAMSLLARSIGAEKPTAYMHENIRSLLNSNDAALTLVVNESTKE